jgi:hypothetical protein
VLYVEVRRHSSQVRRCESTHARLVPASVCHPKADDRISFCGDDVPDHLAFVELLGRGDDELTTVAMEVRVGLFLVMRNSVANRILQHSNVEVRVLEPRDCVVHCTDSACK